MKVTNISFKSTGFFSKTMVDYLEQSETIQQFYTNFPSIEGFKKQLELKRKSFSKNKRTVLVNALKKQYKATTISDSTQQNIEALALENTFSITTGHQLNLFTGPLYFLYKIISVLNLCETLRKEFPKENFVPIYWMASEDHDFEEINYFNFKGKKIHWNSKQTGAVGSFNTEGLAAVLEEFSKYIGSSKNANYIKELFEKAYVAHNNLADATRFIANELFGKYGLIVIDANVKELKQELVPFMQQELEEQVAFKNVSTTIASLEKEYKIQVNPREINLFYIHNAIRERIVFEKDLYKVNNTEITWTKEEIIKVLHTFPERFSPNVIVRPLYQEVLLPNLCYVGGGGEMAYWLELKKYFEAVEVPFPILLLRNSVQIISEKQAKKLKALQIEVTDLFLKQNELLKKQVLANSKESVNFTQQKNFLTEQFKALRETATKTDASFIGAVNAQEKKQLKGLGNLEKRWLRAEKRRQKDLVDRITTLQNELLPNQSLEERQRNFSEYYIEYGPTFIDVLKENLNPLQLEFTVVTL